MQEIIENHYSTFTNRQLKNLHRIEGFWAQDMEVTHKAVLILTELIDIMKVRRTTVLRFLIKRLEGNEGASSLMLRNCGKYLYRRRPKYNFFWVNEGSKRELGCLISSYSMTKTRVSYVSESFHTKVQSLNY